MVKDFKTAGLLAVLLVAAPASYAQSAADCAAHADRVSRGQTSTMGGATGGALGGAVFGAIVGDSSKAAGRGALLGGVIGGARASSNQNDAYKRAYDQCMAGAR